MPIDEKTTHEAFGKLVGVSSRAVSGMIESGTISPGGSTREWLIQYCSHLREIAAGRVSGGSLDLSAERAALARAQRDRIELQNSVTRRELLPAVLLEEILANTASKVAGILDAIPGKVHRRVQSLSSSDVELITEEIASARNTIASMSLPDVIDVSVIDDGQQ